MTVLLDVHSYFSFGAGTSSPEALVRRARLLGYRALALTDDHGVYGAVSLWRAARAAGLTPLLGATVPLALDEARYPLVLIALDRRGYRNLNALLSELHATPGAPPGPAAGSGAGLAPEAIASRADGLVCLTGPRRGFVSELLAARRYRAMEGWLQRLHDAFGERLFVQLFHDRQPRDARRVRTLRAAAHALGLPAVAAPEVRYADPSLYPLYDALRCARLGIDVDTPHPERPRNDAQFLLAPDELERRIPFPDALANAERVLAWARREPRFELLAGVLEPPRAEVPAGLTADEHLAALCHARLRERYPAALQPEAGRTLAKELHILERYGFAEFFLVAAEVCEYCRSRGILASGRGSAAGSVVCFLLGITQADPLTHGLLFERFLHTGMTSFPDVDIDIASSRRAEVLAWVERRFGADTEAMVANRICYRLPSALQDLGRALGVPPALRNRLGRALGRDFRGLPPGRARAAQAVFDEVLGDAPVKGVLLELLEAMEPDTVRHLAPHSGGVVLSRRPLLEHAPLQRSSGGIRLLPFDKDDVEALGLIKLDLLGLRMLAALERAREELHRTEGVWLDLHDLPDEPEVWARAAQGDTLTLFQIESPAQQRISVQMKPASLRDLAHQIALVRPGPIQSGTVHPYLRRRRGEEPVRFLHPSLRPILEDTYGVILFQEQILRIARQVAGMSWPDADRFRKRLTAASDAEALTAERRDFVRGATATVGASEADAEAIFEAMAAFRGYGFAESHAWAFALHAYASLWLRHHHPAEYLAAFLTEAPGMWPTATVRQEAARLGVGWLPLDVNASGVGYRVERAAPAGHGAPPGAAGSEARVKQLRPPLTAVRGVTRAAAQALLLERLAGGPYRSPTDLYRRTRLPRDVLEALVRAGACDRLGGAPGGRRRELLFELEALHHTHAAGTEATPDPGGGAQGGLFDDPLAAAGLAPPPLEPLPLAERLAWDTRLKGFSELPLHPLDLLRGRLRDLDAAPLALLAARAPGRARTAGLVVARQRPPTAGGFAFYVIEDGPLRAQLIIPPALWEAERLALRDAEALLVEGDLERVGVNLALRVERLWPLAAGAGSGRPPPRSFR